MGKKVSFLVEKGVKFYEKSEVFDEI